MLTNNFKHKCKECLEIDNLRYKPIVVYIDKNHTGGTYYGYGW